MTGNSLIADLEILQLADIPIRELTIRRVKLAFFKLSLVKHPDKSGSTSAFQELLNSYHRILKHLSDNLENKDLDDDEQFFKEMFNKFNLPKENIQSFTIIIENCLADAWETILSKVYSSPIFNQSNNGFQWKTEYEFNDSLTKISITLWKKPKCDNQSKILIQGGKQFMNTIFVFNELPRIYKLVNEAQKISIPAQ